MKSKRVLWTVLATIASSSAGAAQPEWERFRGDASNSGHAHVSLRSGASDAAPFSAEIGGLIWGTPVVDADGVVYVGSADKSFYRISRDGTILARYVLSDRADSLVDSAAALVAGGAHGMVVIPGGDGVLHALDRVTFQTLWSFEANASSTGASAEQHQSGVVVNSFEGNVTPGPGGWIYAGSDNGTLYALDGDGKLRWSFKTGMMVWSAPAFSADGAWMTFGSLDGKLYVLNARDGHMLATWKAGAEIKSSPTVSGNRIFVGTSGNRLVALDFDGKRVNLAWSYRTSGEVYSSPAFDGEALYFGSLDGAFHSVSRDGKPRWDYSAHAAIASSPAVSADGVVVFGARNGKLYALDSSTGERLWSFRTSESERRANLDSSPAVRHDGTIVVGSYGGKVYFVPASYCLSHASDPRCERGGTEDLPGEAQGLKSNTGIVLITDRNGRAQANVAQDRHGAFEPIYLKLFGKIGDQMSDHAAISSIRLQVRVTPKARLSAQVSSDGSMLNLVPLEPLRPDTHYRIQVRGAYFENTTWLQNWRALLVGRLPFQGDVSFSTSDRGEDRRVGGRTWEIGGLYLHQPAALDTYTPAALDGQAFLATAIDANLPDGRMLVSMIPAIKGEPGAWKPMLEPSKAFAMSGILDGDQLEAQGKMRISAMGGTIPFDSVRFSGRLSDGAIIDGDFVAQASCLSLKGNGNSYQFPMKLLSFVCDARMRLIAAGLFDARATKPVDSPVERSVLETLGVKGRTLRWNATAGSAQLITAIVYDSQTGAIGAEAHALSTQGCASGLCQIALPAGRGDRVQLLVNQHPGANLPLR